MLTLIGVAFVLGAGVVSAQEAGGEGRRDGFRGRREAAAGGERRGGDATVRAQWNPQVIQERRLERLKETLGSTDDEWAALKPLVEKVLTLQDQSGGGMMARLGMMAGRRPGGDDAPAPALNPVQQATRELQQTLADPDAGARDISARLTALRQARERSEKELEEARARLREVLTQRQEAQLVLQGLLR